MTQRDFLTKWLIYGLALLYKKRQIKGSTQGVAKLSSDEASVGALEARPCVSRGALPVGPTTAAAGHESS